METLVEGIQNGEGRASAVAKMRDMIDAKLGTGASAGLTTLGALRPLLNSGAPSQFQIANGEVGGSARAKLNGWHNELDRAIEGVFANGELGEFWAPSPGLVFIDTARTSPAAAGQAGANATGLFRGLHASQATVAFRPIFGREPDGGARNLLVRTEEFNVSPWGASGTLVASTTIPVPETPATAFRLTQAPTNSEHLLEQSGLPNTPGQYVANYLIKAETLNTFRIMVVAVGHSVPTVTAAFNVNVASGVITTGSIQGGGFITANSAVEVADEVAEGWYLCGITYTLPSGVTSHRTRLYAGAAGVFLGDGTSSLLASKAFVGREVGPYQRVGAAFDTTEAGKPDRWFLRRDPTDDVLVATLPDLGSNATRAFVTEAGVTIQTGQTIGAGPYDILRAERLFGHLVVNRPLTATETERLTRYLERLAP